MARYSFLGLSAFKSSVTISDTTDDTRLLAVLESVSRQVELTCHRRFQPFSATMYFDAPHGSTLPLTHDLLSVTSLKTDANGAGTYENTWTVNTDYFLYPPNAAYDQSPYWRIDRARYNPTYSFPMCIERGVQIVGVWGYWLDLVAQSTLGAAITTTTTTSVTMSASHGLEAGQTILIDSEQLYITAVSSDTLTVERGVNGTTAATYLIAATVSLYRYPGPVVEATRIQAARIFQRVHAPFGITGSAELGTSTVIARIDPDVVAMLSDYRLALVA